MEKERFNSTTHHNYQKTFSVHPFYSPIIERAAEEKRKIELIFDILNGIKAQLEELEAKVDKMWHAPGMPGEQENGEKVKELLGVVE